MRWVVAIMLVVVLAVLGWTRLRSQPHSDPQAAVESLQEQAAEPALQPRRASVPLPAMPDAARLEEEANRSNSRASSKTLVEAGRRRLLERFESEPVDGGWALAREQSLQASSRSPQIEQVQANADNLQIHCRSTTCRISADFDAKSAADDWVTLFVTQAGTGLVNTAYDTSANADGSVHVELYGLSAR